MPSTAYHTTPTRPYAGTNRTTAAGERSHARAVHSGPGCCSNGRPGHCCRTEDHSAHWPCAHQGKKPGQHVKGSPAMARGQQRIPGLCQPVPFSAPGRVEVLSPGQTASLSAAAVSLYRCTPATATHPRLCSALCDAAAVAPLSCCLSATAATSRRPLLSWRTCLVWGTRPRLWSWRRPLGMRRSLWTHTYTGSQSAGASAAARVWSRQRQT